MSSYEWTWQMTDFSFFILFMDTYYPSLLFIIIIIFYFILYYWVKKTSWFYLYYYYFIFVFNKEKKLITDVNLFRKRDRHLYVLARRKSSFYGDIILRSESYIYIYKRERERVNEWEYRRIIIISYTPGEWSCEFQILNGVILPSPI